MHTMSASPKSQPAEVTEEADEDDLSMLDVPDVPAATGKLFPPPFPPPAPSYEVLANVQFKMVPLLA